MSFEKRREKVCVCVGGVGGVFSPLDAVRVSEVMSLSAFFIVEKNHDRCNEVNDLSSWKKVNIGPAVSATVTIPAGGRSQGNHRKTWGDFPMNIQIICISLR